MKAAVRVFVGSLCVLLWLCVPAFADDADSRAAVQSAIADLGSREAETRKDAVGRLERLLVDHPEHGPRCVAKLKDVLRKRDRKEREAVMAILPLVTGPDAEALWFERLDPEVEAEPEVLIATVDSARLRRTDGGFERALVRFVRDPKLSPARRALGYEALGVFEGPGPMLLLRSARPDETWVEAAGRAMGLGRRRDEASLGLLVGLLEHDDLAVRIHAWEGLVDRTREPYGPTEVEAWKAWWAERQAKPEPKNDVPESPDERYARPKHLHVPTYYEVPIPRPRSRVAFCLDTSQSMYGDGIDSARRHLTKTLKDLPSTHGFDVIAFNEKVFPYAGRPVPAHPVEKWLAITWLNEFQPTSYTNIYDAVETAYQYMGRGTKPADEPVPLDMIFLLSDGSPNRGRYRNDDYVVKHIGRLSEQDVPVHTIGAGERVKGLLKRIAEATGGVFVDAFE